MSALKLIKNNKLLAVVFLVYIILAAIDTDKAILSVKNSMYYIIEMLEIMPVIFVLTSIIEVWVPKEVILKGFGEKSGLKGNALSFVLGSISAGPIYAAFPVCKMLLRKGSSVVNIVIILSTWAVIKVPMLANEAKFLGAEFMGVRWILTVISIFIMAYAVSAFIKRDSMPLEVETKDGGIDNMVINQQYCMGCGLCARLLPDGFEMVDKKARWKKQEVISEELERLKDIIIKCPSKAISIK